MDPLTTPSEFLFRTVTTSGRWTSQYNINFLFPGNFNRTHGSHLRSGMWYFHVAQRLHSSSYIISYHAYRGPHSELDRQLSEDYQRLVLPSDNLRMTMPPLSFVSVLFFSIAWFNFFLLHTARVILTPGSLQNSMGLVSHLWRYQRLHMSLTGHVIH